MFWKLFRQDAFGANQIYYIEGSRADLFALIGYIYCCYDTGTRHIFYKRVPAIPKDECALLMAHWYDYCKAYYLKKKEEATCKN